MYSFNKITVKFYFDFSIGVSTIEDLVRYKIPRIFVKKSIREEATALAELYLKKNLPKQRIFTAEDIKSMSLLDKICQKNDFLATLSMTLNKLPSEIEQEDFALMYLILEKNIAINSQSSENKIKIPNYKSIYGDN